MNRRAAQSRGQAAVETTIVLTAVTLALVAALLSLRAALGSVLDRQADWDSLPIP